MGGDAAHRAALRSVGQPLWRNLMLLEKGIQAKAVVTRPGFIGLLRPLRDAGRRHRPGSGLDDRPERGRVSVGLLVQPRAVLLDVQRDHVRRPRQVSAVAEVGRADDWPHPGQTVKIKAKKKV